jgi:hypothetical protein
METFDIKSCIDCRDIKVTWNLDEFDEISIATLRYNEQNNI